MPKAPPKDKAAVDQAVEQEEVVQKVGLGLTPNEVIGYRIVPDWYSYNVQLIKRRGASSKNAGQEYGETLGYCKNLPFAVRYIITHATKMYGEELQDASEEINKTIGDAKALEVAIGKAEAVALAAVAELEARIAALGLDQKSLVKALGGADDAPDDAAAAAA
jgi:uncharacterized small protein (DUF1192 family)